MSSLDSLATFLQSWIIIDNMIKESGYGEKASRITLLIPLGFGWMLTIFAIWDVCKCSIDILGESSSWIQ